MELHTKICLQIEQSREVNADDPQSEPLSPTLQRILMYWISNAIAPAKHHCGSRDSYQLKHDVEEETDYYVSNAQFKMAMLLCGYAPKDPLEQNWTFFIKRAVPRSRKSGEYEEDWRWCTVPYGVFNRELAELTELADAD